MGKPGHNFGKPGYILGKTVIQFRETLFLNFWVEIPHSANMATIEHFCIFYFLNVFGDLSISYITFIQTNLQRYWKTDGWILKEGGTDRTDKVICKCRFTAAMKNVSLDT